MRYDATTRTADYAQVPAGTYRCRVAEVRPGTTRANDERWSLRLVVDEGPHVGAFAAWDSIVFSLRGRARARMIFAAILPSTGKVRIEPKDVEGRKAMVDVVTVEYATASDDRIRRNEVPYSGWRALGDA